MSRHTRFLILPAVITGLWACDSTPTASRDGRNGIGPQLAATHSEVTTSYDFVDDPADCTANPRIGEVLLFTGRVTVVVRTTTASSGNVNASGFFTYDPAVHLVGQTSGALWMIDAARTHPSYSDNFHGAGESFQAVDIEYYTNASGARLTVRGNAHLTVTAQGRVALERPLVWECIGG